MIGARENSFLSQQLNDFLVRLHARPIIKILLNLSKGFMELSSIPSYEPTAPRACPCMHATLVPSFFFSGVNLVPHLGQNSISQTLLLHFLLFSSPYASRSRFGA
jgi:hypothetical protein